MKRIAFLFLICVFALYEGEGVQAQDEVDEVVLAAESVWIPYATPEADGLTNRIVRQAYEAAGMKVKFEVLPFARMLKDVEEGRYVGGFNLSINPESMEMYKFGRMPVMEIVSSYYMAADNPLDVPNRDGIKAGTRIAVVRGFNYGFHYTTLMEEGRLQPIWVSTESQSLNMLVKHRVDTVILAAETADYLIGQQGLGKRIVKAFDNETHGVYIAFSKKYPNVEYYIRKFDEGMEKIIANVQYQKILQDFTY